MESQYAWQVPDRQPTPFRDLTDEEFEKRLEQLIEQREALYGKKAA
jgi:hypothetical protein